MTTVTVVDEPVTGRTGGADARIAAVREFGRFWARDVVAWLDGGLTGSTYSPAEARVIFDLGSGGPAEIAQLRATCGIDVGHLARIVHRLRNEGAVATWPSSGPGGPVVTLTAHGQEVLAVLDRQIAEHARSILAGLREDRQRDVVAAMAMIRRALSGEAGQPFMLRPPRPGDLGWVIQRHGAVYADEFGWDERFEGEVAEQIAAFATGRDPARERAWIAEVDAAPAGCVFCVKDAAIDGAAGTWMAGGAVDRGSPAFGRATVDGAAVGGAAVGGAAVGGAAVDGAAVDGAAVDGAAVDGAAVDGAAVDGRAVVGSAATDGPAGEDARLSLLLVDPAARGLGLGRRLVGECVVFARRAGYRRLLLQTEDLFISSLRIVEAAGFELVDERPHRRYGHCLLSQHWVLPLTPVLPPTPS